MKKHVEMKNLAMNYIKAIKEGVLTFKTVDDFIVHLEGTIENLKKHNKHKAAMYYTDLLTEIKNSI